MGTTLDSLTRHEPSLRCLQIMDFRGRSPLWVGARYLLLLNNRFVYRLRWLNGRYAMPHEEEDAP